MMDYNKKKADQLGMPGGTASHRLRKMIMFALLAVNELDTCHQCNKKILTMDELSIEHKTPWLDSEDPKALFFDLNNIAFSHLSCNVSAAKHPNKKYASEEEAKVAKSLQNKESYNKHFTPERRRAKYVRCGN